MTAISKTFGFSASHRLTGLAEGHKCTRLHGHNYTVTIGLDGEVNAAGMVFDYGDLAPFAEFLALELDHRHLGAGDVYDKTGALTDPAVLTFNPTAENLAAYLLAVAHGMFGKVVTGVRVEEGEMTSATVP